MVMGTFVVMAVCFEGGWCPLVTRAPRVAHVSPCVSFLGLACLFPRWVVQVSLPHGAGQGPAAKSALIAPLSAQVTRLIFSPLICVDPFLAQGWFSRFEVTAWFVAPVSTCVRPRSSFA